MDVALTREVSRSIDRCELTHLAREPIHYERAVAQHRAYCDRLEALGLSVIRLPADEAHPDGCFVEDTALVLDEVAILALPGVASRRGETSAVEEALRDYRRLERIELPATLEGGDVMRMGHQLFVGLSSRTNSQGIDALGRVVEPFGYAVHPVMVTGCLHLKSAVTALDDETLLADLDAIDRAPLAPYRILRVASGERAAANVLRVRGEIWGHPGFPRTLDLLDREGYRVTPVDISEFLKAEAGLTCKSILFRRS